MKTAPLEAPTVDTCTYGRMLQGVTHEPPLSILQDVQRIAAIDLSRAKALTVVFSDKMEAVAQMVDWKPSGEVIGRHTGTKACYLTNMMHGGFAVDSPGEFYVGVGLSAEEAGALNKALSNVPDERKWFIDVPLSGGGPLAALMAGCYLVGRFQAGYPAFQEGINEYAKRAAGFEWIDPVCHGAVDLRRMNFSQSSRSVRRPTRAPVDRRESI